VAEPTTATNTATTNATNTSTATNNNNNNAAILVDGRDVVDTTNNPTASNREWVLKFMVRRADGKPTMFQIHINGTMTANSLSACLEQASASVGMPLAVSDIPHPIAGLFLQSNGIFVSLEHLLKTGHDTFQNEVFGLTYTPPPSPSRPLPIPWWQQPRNQLLLLACLPIVGMLLYNFLYHLGPYLWRLMIWISISIFDVAVQLPLQELYRYGPWFIGWEGASLPTICARITYYGDAQFWRRNLQECEDIYATKEESFLRIARPTVYVVILIFVIWVLRQLLHHWQQLARYRHDHFARNAPPPEMVETYRAFQILLRNIRRGLEPPPNQQAQHAQPGLAARGRPAPAGGRFFQH
jgi:hypothetical protein